MSQKNEIERAAHLLKQGELVAFPTETVYGIGALLHNKEAVDRLYKIKKRPRAKPFTIHLYSVAQAKELYPYLPTLFYTLAERFLPGPLTIITKNDTETIGIRISSHPIAMELMRLVGEPIVASSANLSTQPPAISAEELADFKGLATILDGGKTDLQIGSTIVKIVEDHVEIVRAGTISKRELEKVCPIW